jgi:CheY-like chemotaxis protein
MGNAIKFTQQGAVTLRLGTSKNEATRLQIANLQIEVADTGIGITPEDQQLIFKPFVQLGSQSGSKGAGLGLTITHQLVQMMDGDISLESAPGKGTVFKVDLPLVKAKESDIVNIQPAEMSNVTGLAPEQPEYRILIVEDQYENQLLLAKLMESVGFKVKIAENGEQGVEMFRSWQPHFIWMDRRMPGMDGEEATRRIRELPGGKQVKIAAVTASAFAEEREKMLAAGMDDYVRKPYRTAEIYNCLSKHLDVRYVYEASAEQQEQDVSLTPEMLESLPEELVDEFKEALEDLDAEHIEAVIKRTAKYDQVLQKKLSYLAGNYDYPAILRVLR